MDRFLIKSVNPKYPLSCRKCVQKWTFCILCSAGPPKCVAPPKNGTTIKPRYLPTYNPWDTLMPHLSFIEKKIDFLKAPNFWQITQMALESPKIDICQNWPRRVPGDVIRCLESKFVKKIPMESIPNCQKRNSQLPCY